MFKRLEAIRNSHHSDNPRIALQFAMCLHKVPIVYESMHAYWQSLREPFLPQHVLTSASPFAR